MNLCSVLWCHLLCICKCAALYFLHLFFLIFVINNILKQRRYIESVLSLVNASFNVALALYNRRLMGVLIYFLYTIHNFFVLSFYNHDHKLNNLSNFLIGFSASNIFLLHVSELFN